jgi:hypothetical protein
MYSSRGIGKKLNIKNSYKQEKNIKTTILIITTFFFIPLSVVNQFFFI